MTTREEMLGLAGRCEAATGADRELDALIIQAIHFGSEWRPYRDGARALWLFGTDGKVIHYGGKRDVPAYTASLDAAMTLVPEGWGWNVSQPNAKAIASGILKERTPVHGEVQNGSDHRYAVAGATPALALTAACLRARAAQIGGGL